MNLKAIVFVVFTIVLSSTLPASTPVTAHELIDNLAKEILTVVRASSKENYKENLRQVIENKYIERIDFLRITKSSTGTKAFNRATKEQQGALVEEYSEYLTSLMITAAYKLPEYSIELIPPASDEQKKKTEVGLILKDAETGFNIEVDFILHSLDGPWKIYDLNIAGTSAMIASKFFIKSSIEKHGFDGLIDDLKKLNEAATSKH